MFLGGGFPDFIIFIYFILTRVVYLQGLFQF